MRAYITEGKYSFGTELQLIDGSVPFYAMVEPSWISKLGTGLHSIPHNMLDTLMGKSVRRDMKVISENLRHSGVRSGLVFASGNTFMGSGVYTAKEIMGCDYRFPIQTSANVFAGKLANEIGFSDFVMTDSTACISSANALMLAKMFIDNGVLDRVIIVSIENPLYTPTTEFFTGANACLTAKDEMGGFQPSAFDKHNYGFRLGQGCAYAVLVNDFALAAQDIHPKMELMSSASCAEAFPNWAGQNENGDGYIKAITKAFSRMDGWSVGIDLVKAHGSGTISNNTAERAAIDFFFEDTPVTSYKSAIGHTFGPSALIELLHTYSNFVNGKIEGIANRTTHDDIYLSYDIEYSEDVMNVLCLSSGMSNVFNATIVKMKR